MNTKVRFLTEAAMIAAVYTVLTLALEAFSFGMVQCRISEALNVLTYFTPAAIPGVTIGCLLSNLLGGASLPDIFFGTLATFFGTLLSRRLRRHRWLVPLPAIVSNTLILPWVLRFAYAETAALPFLMLTVGIGELISAGVLGMCLLFALEKAPGLWHHSASSGSSTSKRRHRQ